MASYIIMYSVCVFSISISRSKYSVSESLNYSLAMLEKHYASTQNQRLKIQTHTHTKVWLFLSLLVHREMPYLPCSKSSQTCRSIAHRTPNIIKIPTIANETHTLLWGEQRISTLKRQLHSIISFSSLINVRYIFSAAVQHFHRVLIIRFVWAGKVFSFGADPFEIVDFSRIFLQWT